MTASVQATIFGMATMFLEACGTKDFVLDHWAMTGLRKKKRFGFTAHRCPLCRVPMHYHTVMCKARDERGSVVGEAVRLPWSSDPEVTHVPAGHLPGKFMPTSQIRFGVCPNGHQTAKVKAVGDSEREGTLIYEFRDDQMKILSNP